MASMCRVSMGGNTFVCTSNVTSAVLLDDAPPPSVPDGVVCDATGVPMLRSVLIVTANCVFDQKGCVERLSPALLGVFLRCYGAAKRPDVSFTTVLTATVYDQSLATLCKSAVNYTPKMSATKAAGCRSLHHPRDGIICKLDPRSRSPRCTQCYDVEDNIRKATWPVVSSLAHRLDPQTHTAVLAAITTLSRQSLLGLLGRTHHDLQLAKNPKIERIGHWLYKITPHAEAIEGIRRSKFSDVLVGCVDDLSIRGWAVAPKSRFKRGLGSTIHRVGDVLLISQFLEAARMLCCASVKVHLTAPGQQHNSTGPLEKFSLKDLVAALSKGQTVLHGCRVPPSSAALELVAVFGKLGYVERAPLGPEHAYLGWNSSVREFLAGEEEKMWVGPAVPAELADFVHRLRNGEYDKGGVCGVLRKASGKGEKDSKETAPHGEKPPKRTAIATAETVQNKRRRSGEAESCTPSKRDQRAIEHDYATADTNREKNVNS